MDIHQTTYLFLIFFLLFAHLIALDFGIAQKYFIAQEFRSLPFAWTANFDLFHATTGSGTGARVADHVTLVTAGQLKEEIE